VKTVNYETPMSPDGTGVANVKRRQGNDFIHTRGRAMILIVEDDPIARRALQSLFTANGYESQGVSSGEAALQVLAGPGAPDIVLIDIDLPGMSGLELLRAVRARHPTVSCTLMSANEQNFLAAEGRQADGVEFYPKPLDWRRVLAGFGGDRRHSVA
jgi:CheY-like chemotaxis protein